ncbi:hypothetical protein MNBD_GAMMA22-2686 [hydrothermal vent metagenome]|uniref:Uncharacterized protein n=1 Tax=hydrothermal vent metagenome TaxID=652676 RepID=A0A3B1AF64_9ZZZZ
MNCLVLIPINQQYISDVQVKISNALLELNITQSAIINNNTEYFFAGDSYLQFISFLGCSPYLNFNPQKQLTLSDLKQTIADLNYIQILSNSEDYVFLNTQYGVKAICPACKKKMTEWQSLIIQWQSNLKLETNCKQCLNAISLLDIDWKRTAGFFKTAIIFHGIQAELAVPSDELLLKLEKLTKLQWQYFYG